MQSQIRLAEEAQAKEEARARKRASVSSTARSRKGKQNESQIVNAFESVPSVVVAPAKRGRGRPRKKENIDSGS